MKQFALSILGLFLITTISAQDELALTHQTIVAKSYEMSIFDPVFLDLNQNQQPLVDDIVQMLISGEESYLIAPKLETAIKATGLDQMNILRWVVREAAIIQLNLQNIPAARTWDFKTLLECDAARDLQTTKKVINYFGEGKSVLSSIE